MPSIAQVFGAARIGVGLVSWLSPPLTARVFGFPANRDHAVVTQLFGAREVALGALTAASAGSAQRDVLRLGVAIDAADALASARQIRAGAMGRQAVVMIAVGAAAFTATGIAALRQPSG